MSSLSVFLSNVPRFCPGEIGHRTIVAVIVFQIGQYVVSYIAVALHLERGKLVIICHLIQDWLEIVRESLLSCYVYWASLFSARLQFVRSKRAALHVRQRGLLYQLFWQVRECPSPDMLIRRHQSPVIGLLASTKSFFAGRIHQPLGEDPEFVFLCSARSFTRNSSSSCFIQSLSRSVIVVGDVPTTRGQLVASQVYSDYMSSDGRRCAFVRSLSSWPPRCHRQHFVNRRHKPDFDVV